MATLNYPVKVTTSTPHLLTTGAVVEIAGVGGIPGANGTWTVSVLDAYNFYLGAFNTDSYNGCSAQGVYTSGGTMTTATTSGGNTSYWAKAAWGESDQGYPGCSAYFQDRQLFAGSYGQPFVLWMSRTAGFLDFGKGDPVLDDDAVTYKLLANEVNIIRHMMELTYLLIFTSGGIWMVQGSGSNSNVITPANINFQFQAANAVSDIHPLRISNYALFIQEKGSQVRTLGYSFAENAFLGKDATVMSSHLLQFNKIIEWAFQEIPYGCVWSIRDDGVLLGMTFFPEQEIIAWHHHDTQGTFESICHVNEDYKDVLYFIVNRTLNGQTVRCIERMAQRAFDDQVDGYFVDCGLTYDGRSTGIKASTFSGLDHLEGMTVSICADGIVYPQQVVHSGQVTIVNPALVAHIGLPYISDFETLDISSKGALIRDKEGIINAVSMIVDRSSGFEVGPDADNLVSYKTRTTENYDTPDNLVSDLIDISVLCDWSKDSRVFVRQEKPLPVSILAVIPQYQAGGH